MGIMSKLGDIKMFFTGKNGEVHEIDGTATAELNYEPAESEYQGLSFDDTEYTLTCNDVWINPQFEEALNRQAYLTGEIEKQQKILFKTKKFRIKKKAADKIYNLLQELYSLKYV